MHSALSGRSFFAKADQEGQQEADQRRAHPHALAAPAEHIRQQVAEGNEYHDVEVELDHVLRPFKGDHQDAVVVGADDVPRLHLDAGAVDRDVGAAESDPPVGMGKGTAGAADVRALQIGFIAVPAAAVDDGAADAADHRIHRDLAAPDAAADPVHIDDDHHVFGRFRGDLVHKSVDIITAFAVNKDDRAFKRRLDAFLSSAPLEDIIAYWRDGGPAVEEPAWEVDPEAAPLQTVQSDAWHIPQLRSDLAVARDRPFHQQRKPFQ